MKVSTHNRLVIGGFVVSYLAGMAAMVVASSERLGPYQDLLLWKILAPVMVLGLILILVGKLSRVTTEDGPD